MKSHILIVDDDDSIRGLLEKYLIKNEFLVLSAQDTREAREYMNKYIFDLIVLDRMLPMESGTEFANSLRRENKNIPILMLTAMGETSHKIEGFEIGVDDYLTKPFEPRELILRINAILSRSNVDFSDKNLYTFGKYIFDSKIMNLKKNGGLIKLSEGEAKILKILCENMNKVISREYISNKMNSIEHRSIDVQVARLRKKIEIDTSIPEHLKTVRGGGYILND